LHALRRGYGFRGVSSVPVSLFFVKIWHNLLTDKPTKPNSLLFGFSCLVFFLLQRRGFLFLKLNSSPFISSHLWNEQSKLFFSNPAPTMFIWHCRNLIINYLNQRIKSIINHEECERTELKKNYSNENKTKYKTKGEFIINKKEKHSKPIRASLVMWLRMRFTHNHTYQCLVKQKKMILLGRTHQLSLPCRKIWRSSILLLLVGIFNEQWSSHAPLSHCSRERFFFVKNQCKNFGLFFSLKNQCS